MKPYRGGLKPLGFKKDVIEPMIDANGDTYSMREDLASSIKT